MPVYEYLCDECGKRFSLHRHFGDSRSTVCPDGHSSVQRLFAPPTIIFKGSGFYVTDNGRDGHANKRHSVDTKSSKPEEQASKASAKEGETE